jgi:hypothetical protein
MAYKKMRVGTKATKGGMLGGTPSYGFKIHATEGKSRRMIYGSGSNYPSASAAKAAGRSEAKNIQSNQRSKPGSGPGKGSGSGRQRRDAKGRFA